MTDVPEASHCDTQFSLLLGNPVQSPFCLPFKMLRRDDLNERNIAMFIFQFESCGIGYYVIRE